MCLPVNIAKSLRIAFFIEQLRQVLLCLLERKEEESMEQRSEEHFF